MTAAHAEAFNAMIANVNEGDRRYTLERTLELCKRLALVDAFDLDVAQASISRWLNRKTKAPAHVMRLARAINTHLPGESRATG